MTKEKKRSQREELKRIVISTLMSMVIGCLFLVLTIGANVKRAGSLEQQNEITQNTNQYRMASKGLTYNVQAYAVTGRQEYYDAYMKEVNEDQNREKAIAALEELGLTEEEWSMINQVADFSNGLVPMETEALEKGAAGDLETAQSMVFGKEYEEIIGKINEVSDQLIIGIGERMETLSFRLHIQSIMFEVLMGCSFLAIVWQVMRVIKFARVQLLWPILIVEEQMEEIAEGNLHADFPIEPDESEVGKMVAAILKMKGSMEDMIGETSEILNQMAKGNFDLEVRREYVGDFAVIKESAIKIIQDMNETLGIIDEVSDQVKSGADQLSSASQEIAQSSTNQASIVQELAASMKKLAENMLHNAQATGQCVQLSTDAGEALMIGNSKMEELEAAISNISQCSEKISGIIETINDIATQTNLLALNAAIEAARAGEAGKGFAVVAEQVKSLAGESSEAVGETTTLIQETVNAVNIGIGLAEETKVSIGEVMEGAKTATEKMAQIAEKLNQDVDSIGQVNIAINQVAEVVENNTSASEETAAISEQQQGQVETMAQLVGKFRIKQRNN